MNYIPLDLLIYLSFNFKETYFHFSLFARPITIIILKNNFEFDNIGLKILNFKKSKKKI